MNRTARAGLAGLLAAALAALTACTGARPVGADTLPADTPERAAARAAHVFAGTILQRLADADRGGRRWLLYRVRVDRLLKGSLNPLVDVARPVGSPGELAVGRKYVLISSGARETWQEVPATFTPPSADAATVKRFTEAVAEHG
ncbi:hypothetical protein GCM10010123_00580 [Pilimelia anulata]|uniref:Lipoprotein n=1 Tax=Pilimelia anulata TaxID=53371 RepID=A0A8J3AYB0_9ACTN|nr:hypothetical protein [Pilimelia anulata]GGJ74482.1 hypothetical protein GCM10010123_00580 [Pilimelia anulata]